MLWTWIIHLHSNSVDATATAIKAITTMTVMAITITVTIAMARVATATTTTIAATTTMSKKRSQGLAADLLMAADLLKTGPYNAADGPFLALLPNPTIPPMGTNVDHQNHDNAPRATTATAPNKRTVKAAQTKATTGKAMGKAVGTVTNTNPATSG